MKQPAFGACKLTERRGRFVRSHIIPRALTKPEAPGAPFIQGAIDRPPVRRWSSWYDERLVIQAGETILRDYDTQAIQQLRRHKLIWSAWGDSSTLPSDDHRILENTPYGVRQIANLDSTKLRLFFLSLLWRAAATNLHEFADVALPAEDLEKLRIMVLNECFKPISFYPIQLIQISTKGLKHNHTVLASDKTIPAAGDETDRSESVYRFYLDGLIAHVLRQAADDGRTERLGPLVLGNGDKLLVTTVTYTASRQRMILSHIMQKTYSSWPETGNF